MESTADKWVKLTDNGEWGSHSVSVQKIPSWSFFPFINVSDFLWADSKQGPDPVYAFEEAQFSYYWEQSHWDL